MGRTRLLTPQYRRHRDKGRVIWTDANGVRCFKALPGLFESDESRKASLDLGQIMTALIQSYANADFQPERRCDNGD